MKNITVITGLITASVLTLLFYPVKEKVVIIKKEITSNQPFAGKINGKVVGTNVCCTYWLEPNSVKDTMVYIVTKPLVFQHLGYVWEVKQ